MSTDLLPMLCDELLKADQDYQLLRDEWERMRARESVAWESLKAAHRLCLRHGLAVEMPKRKATP